jgi:mxaA protein
VNLHRTLLAAALLALMRSVAAESPPTPAAPAATVEQPRSFGHVLGDVLTQRVLLSHAGRPVDAGALPAADRVGLYLERRTPRVEEDALGRRWLAIDYQVVNAPRALTAAALPALSITTSAGPLQVVAWPVSIGPLTPPATFDQGALQPLRPDRPVLPVPTEGLERQLKLSLTALAVVLLGWAAWWAARNAREARRLPFARAWQQLRQADPASTEAWRALHRALDATAGRVVHGRTLPRLLADAPHLQPLAPQLEAFFRHSEQRFFASEAGTAPADLSLRALGLALREAERRHHR